MSASNTTIPYDYSIPGSIYFYIAQSSYTITMSSIVTCAILRWPELRARKEYMIVVAIAVADGFYALGFWIAAFSRIKIIMDGDRKMMVRPWTCMSTTVFSPLLIYGAELARWMMICASVDRLWSVTFPLKYYTYDTRYAYKMILFFYGVPITISTMFVFMSYYSPDTERVSIFCLGSRAITTQVWVDSVRLGSSMFTGCTSVILYMFVPFIYRRALVKTTSTSVTLNHMRTQRRLLVTMGMSTTCTLITYVFVEFGRVWLNMNTVPFGIGMDLSTANYWKVVGAVVQNINPMMTMIFLVWRHKDLRNGVVTMLRCKNTLPSNVVVSKSTSQKQSNK